MKYVIPGFKGAFIAIVCGFLLTFYFGGEIDFESMALILVYGFIQGAMSKLIDEYVTIALLEFISQALASYLLAWVYLLVNTWLFDSSWRHHILSFTITWLLIFILVYLYSIIRNRQIVKRFNRQK
jgi:VIT1/CCC1 family predicted Fe2+/Mn2+ transporter